MGSGTGERSICMSYLKCTNGETLNKRLNLLPVPQCNHTGSRTEVFTLHFPQLSKGESITWIFKVLCQGQK